MLLLVEYDEDVGKTPFQIALKYGLEEVAKNIFLQAPKGLALHQACAEGRTSVVEWLLEFSRETYYSFTYRDGYGQTAMHHAVIKDNIDVVKILQSDKDADHFHRMEVLDYKGILPIHLATKNGCQKVLRFFPQSQRIGLCLSSRQ